MARRSGTTLIEVLVAIFVMGIGLIALLTLFPIGVLRFVQAIHDNKSAQSGANAHAISIAQNVRNDPLVVTVPSDPDSNGAPIPDVFKNPYPNKAGQPSGMLNADDYAESYAIFVDPVGYYSVPALTSAQDWVGGVPGMLRRRPVSFVANNLDIHKNFTLWDDISFDRSSTISAAPGSPQRVANAIFRDSRFSWGYLLRRPQTVDRSVVDCSVVVFDERPLSLSGTMTLAEYIYPKTYFDTTRNAITIDYTNSVPPPIRPGNWILDATVIAQTVTTATQHAYYYRVVAVNDISTTMVQYEVQNPLRGFNNLPAGYPTDATYGYQGTAIIIDGVAEVFEKGPTRAP